MVVTDSRHPCRATVVAGDFLSTPLLLLIDFGHDLIYRIR